MSDFQPLEVVDRGSETQLQAGEKNVCSTEVMKMEKYENKEQKLPLQLFPSFITCNIINWYKLIWGISFERSMLLNVMTRSTHQVGSPGLLR